MNELIDWNKLKTYNSNQNKSFEELCYQITYEEFGSLGTLTSIDDSGGGDGVEFYLEMPNGDIWGWQCKFFGRFNEGGRKEQIKSSLQRAYDKHGYKLKKWILCSKLSLTPTEKTWYETHLSSSIHNSRIVLPENNNVELEHWGDSVILNYLRKYPDIHRYFLIEKLLDFDWYKQKFDLVSKSTVIKSKYLNRLHVTGNADEKVIQILGGERLAILLEERKEHLDINRFLDDYKQEIKDIESEENIYNFTDEYRKIKKFILSNDYPNIVIKGNNLIKDAQNLLNKEDYSALDILIIEISKYQDSITQLYTEFAKLKDLKEIPSFHWDTEDELNDDAKKREIKKCRDTILAPYFTLRNFLDAYLNVFDTLKYLKQNELHISGNASKGKTHLAVSIVEFQVNQNKPAIFLFGKDFRSNAPLGEQIKLLLDIPTDWSLNDFFGALNISGRVNNTKSILLIDGLNESIHWKQIWGSSLEELINNINQNYPNILFITTYRKSYQEQLFPKDYFDYKNEGYKKIIFVNGFDRENTHEAIKKYFDYYDIKIVNNSSAMNHFSEPLYLKIFCEAKRGQKVSFQNEDLFDVFDEYLVKSNNQIINNLGKEIRFNKRFTQGILEGISKSLWKNSSRDVKLKDVIPSILKANEFLVFEGEDLLIFRDWNKEEVVTFTYDLLSGYLIAKVLVEKITTLDELLLFINSEKFNSELITRETLHPLYNDILRSFSVLIIKKFGLSFYNDNLNDSFKEYILKSIFEVNTNTVIENKEIAIEIVRQAFDNSQIFNLFENTELDSNHPLNFELLSELLKNMTMSDRDVYWTEYARNEYASYSRNKFKRFIEDFEKACKENDNLSDKIHLASKKIMWFLTSTNLEMRDKATKALYFYGKRFPRKFFELVEYSLQLNDPYIWQRTLASLYGIVLAKHNVWYSLNFQKKILPHIAKKLYNLIFSETAPHSTTNIIARDYVQRIIEVCLIHHPTILTDKEIANTLPPFKFGGIREWGEYDYGEKDYGYDRPMRMDFSNYTLGTIVPNGHSYSNPPEKQEVRKQIYWRIYDLGWNEKKFEDAEKGVGNMIRYNSRTEKPKIERYGKKYSWIAFYELYGYRKDNGLVKDEWSDFRISESDIDPTFPELPENKIFIKDDLLGDRNMPLIEWHKNAETPNIEKYLEISNLNKNEDDWICLDGFVAQKDEEANRKVFAFIRGIFINENDFDDFLKLHTDKDFRNGNGSRVSENYYTYAGEMHTLDEATYSNFDNVQFNIGSKKKIVKKGDEGYRPEFSIIDGIFTSTYPDEKEIVEVITKDFEILMSVAQYSWESYHSSTNQSGHQNVISKEIASHLELIDVPQTFNLHEKNGKLASINLRYHTGYNSNQHFVYLRKDLFEKFLKENNYKFIWSIWGEREFHFKGYGSVRKFIKKNKITESYQKFKIVKPYN